MYYEDIYFGVYLTVQYFVGLSSAALFAHCAQDLIRRGTGERGRTRNVFVSVAIFLMVNFVMGENFANREYMAPHLTISETNFVLHNPSNVLVIRRILNNIIFLNILVENCNLEKINDIYTYQ